MKFNEVITSKKEEVQNEIKKVCVEKKIDIIISIAKKGSFILRKFFPDDIVTIDNDANYGIVPIYTDRFINKNINFKQLRNKKILVFDDTARSGETLKHLEEYLTDKIDDKFNEIEFFFYCLVKCDVLEESKFNGKIKFYLSLPFSEYYEFCNDEALYLQKELLGSSIDLPTFDVTLKDIDEFNKVMSNIDESILTYDALKSKIGNEYIDVGVIMLQDDKLIDALKGFLLALLCKVRYEYDNEINRYRMRITPFALTGSIKYSQLEKLFDKIFSNKFSDTDNESDALIKMDRTFVRMYRYVNVFLSYYIGYKLKHILSLENINIKYTNNCYFQYGYEVNKYIIDIIEDKYFNIISFLDEFDYTKESINYEDNRVYNYDEIKKSILERVVDRKKEKNLMDRFIQIEDLENYYNGKSNLRNFCKTIVTDQEGYVISNEIELDKAKSIVKRGYLLGENGMTLLPMDIGSNIFYAGLYEFYMKCKQNMDIYLNNYDLFINKFKTFLLNKNYFENNIMSIDDYNYASRYFGIDDKKKSQENKINESEFLKEKIESKKFYLEDERLKADIESIRNGTQFLLSSSDFNFNVNP